MTRTVSIQLTLLVLVLSHSVRLADPCPTQQCDGDFEVRPPNTAASSLNCISSKVQTRSAGTISAVTQGFIPIAYNKTSGTTDSYPYIAAPSGYTGNYIGALTLTEPGAAALLYVLDAVTDSKQILSFQWYLCSRSYAPDDSTITLAGADSLTNALQTSCRADCAQWCMTDTCQASCCPTTGDQCSACPTSCNTLCAACLNDCANLESPVQTARVDLFLSNTLSADQLQNQLEVSVLAPGSPPCSAAKGCVQTLLTPTVLGAADTQCGWQSFSVPLGPYMGSTVALVARALDTRVPGSTPLAFALDNIDMQCGTFGYTAAPPGILQPPIAYPPPPANPSTPSPEPPAPAPPYAPLPPLGCNYSVQCSDALGELNATEGMLGPCVSSEQDSPGSSGFVPFKASRATTGERVRTPADIPPPNDVQSTEIVALQLENMGAAALVYKKFVASDAEVLQLQYYICSATYTGDDVFSLSGVANLIQQASNDCSTQCQGNCTACSNKCCTPNCDEACIQQCCFSCFAGCNGLQTQVQSARIDLYTLTPAQWVEDVDALRPMLFRDGASCVATDGCTTLVSPAQMNNQDVMCKWTSFNSSMLTYVGKYIAVVFRAVDSRAPSTTPMAFAVGRLSSRCPAPPPQPPNPFPPNPPAPNPPPQPPSPPYGMCTASSCDGTFEQGLQANSCISTFVQPDGHQGGWQAMPFATSASNVSAPIVPDDPSQGSAYFAQLVQDTPGAAALVFTKFISSPLELLSFRYYICTSANLTDGPYSYDGAIQQASIAASQCEQTCAPSCAQGACNAQCCTPTCNPACVIDCFKRCGDCQQICSQVSPVQSFRADLFQVPSYNPVLDPAVLGPLPGGPCPASSGCLKTVIGYTTASQALCGGWKTQTVPMEPYVGMTVAVVIRAIDMRYPRAYQLSAAVDDISCGCPTPPQPPVPTNTMGKLRRLLGRHPQVTHTRQQDDRHAIDPHAVREHIASMQSHTQDLALGCEKLSVSKVTQIVSQHVSEATDL